MSSDALVDQFVAAVHHLSAAAWFGALVYRAFFVDPKALRFFRASAEFERFSLDLAHGMRYVVLAALLTCGLSGFMLVVLRWNSADSWFTLMAGKVTIWVIAFVLFAYISWVFWPRRVFAVGDELSRVRRRGLVLALVMIAIAGLGIVLGQLAQGLRNPAIGG
jgi:putative copper export protein